MKSTPDQDARQAQRKATDAVQAVNDRLDEAEALLADFLVRFSWVQDHPDFFERVKAFLGSS